MRGISLRDRVRVYARRGMVSCVRGVSEVFASSDKTGVIFASQVLFYSYVIMVTGCYNFLHSIYSQQRRISNAPLSAMSDVRCPMRMNDGDDGNRDGDTNRRFFDMKKNAHTKRYCDARDGGCAR